jgi:hypothetical protein
VLGPYVLNEGDVLRVFVGAAPVQLVTITSGSYAVVVSPDAGPWLLVDGTSLDLTIDGVLWPVAINAVDFDDITAATASELVAVIADAIGPAVALGYPDGALSIGSPTQGSGGSVSVAGTAAADLGLDGASSVGVDFFGNLAAASATEIVDYVATHLDTTATVYQEGGYPVLETADQGDAATLRVEGTVATALGFPVGVAQGTTLPGTAAHWQIVSSSSVSRVAMFDVGLDADPLPFESFEGGWGIAGYGAPGELGVDDVVVLAPETFESGWDLVQTSLGGAVDAPLEDFEAFSTGVSLEGTFAADEPVEDFSGWGSFEDTILLEEDAEFTTPGGTSLSETFGDDGAELAQWVLSWASLQPPAGTYLLNVGSVTHKTVGDGVLFASDLSADLETQVNATGDHVYANEVSGYLMLWRDDLQDFIVTVEAADGAPNTELVALPAATAPALSGYWTAIVQL